MAVKKNCSAFITARQEKENTDDTKLDIVFLILQKLFDFCCAINFSAGSSCRSCPTEGNMDHKPVRPAASHKCAWYHFSLHFGRGYVIQKYFWNLSVCFGVNYEVMCFRISLELIHFQWNADSVIISAMISRNNIIYSSLNSAPAHLFHLLAIWQWLFLKKTNGGNIEAREPDSNIRAAQTSHKLNDTQMTEVIKCSLCHCSISEALSIYLNFHKSVSTLGSLKWQCVCVSCAEEECRRQGWSLFVLADSRVTFTTCWRHGHISSEACVPLFKMIRQIPLNS